MSILDILNELAADPSGNAKKAILQREKKNELLMQVFKAAYNPYVNYWQTKIPSYKKEQNKLTLADAIDALGVLIRREKTGHLGIDYLAQVLGSCTEDDAIVIERIIGRDLRVGCSDSTANKIWPGLVPTFDVMLCGNDMSRIEYPAYVQLKCDGARVHLYFKDGHVTAFSRAGKEFELHNAFDAEAARIMKDGETWDGELLVMQNGKIADRQTGNGILNKASKGTISKEEASMIVAVVWDIVDFTETIPYHKRFSNLESRSLSSKISIVPSLVVANEDEAMGFFAEQLKQGQEGAIGKNMNSVWMPKRSKELCKLKEVNSADLIVVDVQEGTGKYVGMLGALVCETADSKLRVNVGSGFSDVQRAQPLNTWKGKIVEVLYNQKISSKGKDAASLFLPRFLIERFDKTIANTLSELK